MCKFFNVLVVSVALFSTSIVNSQVYETSSVSVTINDNKIVRLHNKLTDTSWTLESAPLFLVDVSGVETKLKAVAMSNGEVKLTLSLKNTSKEKLFPAPSFPDIRGAHIVGRSSKELYYLFPGQGYAPGNIEPANYNDVYSAKFPLQFMDIYDEQAGGFYIMTNDTSNYDKRYALSKQDGKINMQVSFKSRALNPGETWELPAVVIGAHAGDWHDALAAYKSWLKTWYKPYTSRKEWFREIFNFRQVFIHPMFGEPGVYNPATKKIDLVSRVEADMEAFGGVDYVHIFDWMKTPHGRILDYDPWGYLGGHKEMANQVKLIQEKGLRVGLYHEGYIMNKKSKIGLAHGEEWQQLNNDGKAHQNYGPGNYYPCSLVPGWQHYMSDLVENSSTLLGANGVYLDQYGFGFQYGCFNPAHNHDRHPSDFKNNMQVAGEARLAKTVKDKISKEKVLYIEETPTDVSTQYYDGSFSYANLKGRNPKSNNPSVVNLTRFAIPDFKIFQIIKCDHPLGNDQEGVKHIFFNGDGIWLAGPLNDPNWFPEELRKTIRKTHAILRTYKTAFLSENAIPLVPVLQKDIYANYFPSEKGNVWTLFNAGEKDFTGNLLKIKHIKGVSYYDAWNDVKLNPEIKDGYAIIALTVEGRDVGCVVQK